MMSSEIIEDFVAARQAATGDFENYQEWLYASFGKTFTETFPMEYTVKYHGTTADNVSTDWPGRRFCGPTLHEVLRELWGPTPRRATMWTASATPREVGSRHTFIPSPAD
jgi:hypothetical protein